MTCKIPGCTALAFALDWCQRHYTRAYRHGGNPFGGRVSQGEPLAYLEAQLAIVTDDCQLWPYAKAQGYGVISLDGRNQQVHVIACERAHGPRPEGMEAAHGSCHVRHCFNGRRHLSWKTHAENEADKRRDGTLVTGERHPLAKLTETQVAEIRRRYAAGGVFQHELAREFGVAQSNVSFIINHIGWRESA